MSKMYPLFLLSIFFTSASLLAEEEIHAAPPTTVVENITHSPFTPFTGAVIGSKVRMRVSPNLEGHVVRETTNGEMFLVTGELNDYYAIVPPKEMKGYVFRTFILDGNVEGERVNVRLNPDIDAPVIGQLNRGDKVDSSVSNLNNKWLEINLPENSRFYIAKEYVENRGNAELLTAIEKKHAEAVHLLSSATLFAQAEIQKPFEQIDLEHINAKFEEISKSFPDLPTITEQVKDVISLMQDIYVQKKVAFLEGKTAHQPTDAENERLEKLAKLGGAAPDTKDVSEIASAASNTMGLSATLNCDEITDKMLAWQPLEESIYHLWAAANDEKSLKDFYQEEQESAIQLTGIVEPYNRPVKNRPGDFLLREDNVPVAFLYSTQVNLEKSIGKKVTVLAAPRPNHNFAFPAYFVISVE